MRLITLTVMPLLLSLGCAGPEASVTEKHMELRQNACSPQQQAVKAFNQPSEPCRRHHVWLEQVGAALGGFATAVRIPDQ